MNDAITLRSWNTYWAQAGTVLSLAYLSPPAHICRADEVAYRKLIARPGIATSAIFSMRRALAGTPFAGLGAIADHLARYERTGAPRIGYRRLGDVWDAWVIVTRAGLLGNLLPTEIRPCAGVQRGYSLKAVHVMRGSTVQVTALMRASEHVGNALEHVRDVGIGTAIGDTAAAGVRGVLNTTLSALAPLAIPIVAGVILYRHATGR